MRSARNEIRSTGQPDCIACGAAGKSLHQQLPDRLFSAPGKWNIWTCASEHCGLLWLNPMPVKEDLGIAYQQYATHQDPRSEVESSLAKGARLKAVLRSVVRKDPMDIFGSRRFARDIKNHSSMHLAGLRPGKLLEIGPGTGENLRAMKGWGWDTQGVDIDPAAVENARSKGLKVDLGFLEEQNYPSSFFDAVVSLHSLEHIPDPIATVAECVRILRPGGKLVIVTPNSASFGHRLFSSCWSPLDPPRHLYVFNAKSMRKLMDRAQVTNVTVYTTLRDAAQVFSSSFGIWRSGKFDLDSQPSAVWVSLSKMYQALVNFLMRYDDLVGDELVVIADIGEVGSAAS